MYTINDYAAMIDHSSLHAAVTKQEIEQLCKEAIEYQFKMVAINQVQTSVCASLLKVCIVHVGAAIAFPLGQTTIESKVFETKNAIDNGADEIDYVINISKVKEQDFSYIEDEMKQIVNICKASKVISKVIFENCYLTQEEIQKLSEIAKLVQPDYIKTSTGFGPTGAKVADVELMKSVVGDLVQIKAAGGIRDAKTFLAMIKAGATRIGTSSGIKIIEELQSM